MTAFPEWLVPMAATLTQERFTGPEWIFERKFDGIRLLAYKKGDDVQLFSRNHLPQNVPSVQKGESGSGSARFWLVIMKEMTSSLREKSEPALTLNCC